MNKADYVVAAEGAVSKFSHYDDVNEVFYNAFVHFFDDLQVGFFYGRHHKSHNFSAVGCLYVFIRI